MAHLILRLLRVFARPGGLLVFNHRQGPARPVDEEWWSDVLHDPRARTPREAWIDADSIHARYRLDRQPGPQIMLACRCGRGRVLDKEKMIAQVGGSMNVIYLAREQIDCGNRDKVTNHCQAYVVR